MQKEKEIIITVIRTYFCLTSTPISQYHNIRTSALFKAIINQQKMVKLLTKFNQTKSVVGFIGIRNVLARSSNSLEEIPLKQITKFISCEVIITEIFPGSSGVKRRKNTVKASLRLDPNVFPGPSFRPDPSFEENPNELLSSLNQVDSGDDVIGQTESEGEYKSKVL